MALNLLDSLNSSAFTPEKSTFSLKNKQAMDGAASDFSQMLSDLRTSSPGGGPVISELNLPGGKPTSETGIASPEAALTSEASTDLVAMEPPPSLTAIVLSPNMTAITPSQPAPSPGSLVAFAQSQGLDKHVARWLMNAESSQTIASNKDGAPADAGWGATAHGSVPGTGPLGIEGGAELNDPGFGTAHPPSPKTRGQQSVDSKDPDISTGLISILSSSEPKAPLSAPGQTTADKPAEISLSTHAALLASMLTSPANPAPKAPPALAASADLSVSPLLAMPLSPPASWLVQRVQTPSKSTPIATPTAAPGQDKGGIHSSDLDLTLIFASANGAPKPAEAAHVPFTPAAWVMSGLSGGAAPTASAMANLALPKGISEDQTGHENASPMGEVDGIQAEITPGAPRSSQSITPGPNNLTKGVEPGLSTAERSELHQAQAEKMGQAIGQRMISEMEKGHWHLKMMLKPANLGNVEVEMRMRNGELDANFTASQAVTRDLLQDGLPKLRDTLTQMGMDVASMNIGGGSSQKNGGEPTPQQAHNSTSAPPAKPQEEQVAGQSPQVSSSATDGLDVLV